MNLNLDLYCQRLKLNSPLKVSEESLFLIQSHQLTSIAFENIDCLTNLPIKTDRESLEDKLLKRGRGGYCFELNTLLQYALKEVGFTSRHILSRSMWRGPNINAKTHIFVLVKIENKTFLADAGFGGPGISTPMPFEIGRVDHQKNGSFRLTNDETFGTILQKKSFTSDAWENVYSFNLETVFPADIEMSNFYTYTSPGSYFRQNLVAALFTENGRVTLLNNRLNQLTNDGKTESFLLSSANEIKTSLKQHFHLDINAEILEPYVAL